MSLWYCGFMVLCHYGTVAFWYYLMMVLRHYFTMTLWYRGIMALWHYGTVALWCSVIMALWHYGTMSLRCCGIMVLCQPGESRPREAWPEDCSIYIYIYVIYVETATKVGKRCVVNTERRTTKRYSTQISHLSDDEKHASTGCGNHYGTNICIVVTFFYQLCFCL